MGIRIKKMLGYGLTDIKYDTENWEFIDDRINSLGYLCADYEDQEDTWNHKGWIKYIEGLIKKDNDDKIDLWLTKTMFYDSKELKHWEPYDSVVHDGEFGDDKILLIIPPCHSYGRNDGWIRYDNIIDYHEEYATNKDAGEPRHKFIDGGIFPYQSFYMNKKTGESLGREGHHFRYDYRWLKDTVDLSLVHHMWQYMDKLAKKIGFEGYLDAEENIVPIVSDEVKYFCKWLNLFNDDSTIYELKPLLYVYWS